MRRFFVKNLLFVLTVNLLVKPLWIFLIDRTVQNRVGHSVYGTYQAVFNLGVIFQILLDFGLNYYNTTVISQNPGRLRALFPAMLTTRLLLILIYAGVVTGIGLWLGYSGWELFLLLGVMLIQVFSSLVMFIRSNVSALHKFKADGMLSISDRLLMILICGTLLFAPAFAAGFKIEWFILSQIVSYALAFIIGCVLLMKISTVRFTLTFNIRRVMNIVKQSAPYALLIFLMAVYTRSDTTLIERLLGHEGKQQAGIYAAAYRLLDVGNMVGLMLSGILLPLFGRMIMQKENVNPIVSLSTNMMLPVAFTMAIAASFFGTDIMQLLYKNTGDYDGTVFAILMASFPAFCVMYIYSTLLTAIGKVRLLTILSIAGVIINLSLNYILIHRYAALGAAITTLITQTTLAACFILFSRKHAALELNARLVFAHVGFVLLLVAVGYLLQMLPISWILQLCLLGATGGIMIFLFRFVSLASVQMLLTKKQD